MHEEGWYVDPFGRHDARWISDGAPTALVRDARAVSQDDPPRQTFDGEFVRMEGITPVDGADLLRSDGSTDPPYDPDAGPLAAFDLMARLGPGAFWHPKRGRGGQK
jgi:hypothetical protein